MTLGYFSLYISRWAAAVSFKWAAVSCWFWDYWGSLERSSWRYLTPLSAVYSWLCLVSLTHCRICKINQISSKVINLPAIACRLWRNYAMGLFCFLNYGYPTRFKNKSFWHYSDDVIMASQITSLTNVYSAVYSRRRAKKTSKLRVTGLLRGIHRWPVNSAHKGPVTRKMFSFDDVIMKFPKLG